MNNYKIAHGQVNFSITQASGFRSVQVIYDDVYDDFVCFLTRSDIMGKSLEKLLDEGIQFIETVKENRKNLFKIVNSIKTHEMVAYTKTDLVNHLNFVDPEIVKLCGLPITEFKKNCNTACMDFKLSIGGNVSFYFDKESGFKSLRAIYDDGCVFSLDRSQVIGKTFEQIKHEIPIILNRTAENRKTFNKIIQAIFSENPISETKRLLDLLIKSDPEICAACNIISIDER